MKSTNIITLGELQNVDIEEDNIVEDISLSAEEKVRNENSIINRKIDEPHIVKPKKMKLSLTKKILISVIPIIIIIGGIITVKYIFFNGKNKSDSQFYIDPKKKNLFDQKKKAKFAIPKNKSNSLEDSDSNSSEDDKLWENIQDKMYPKKDDVSDHKPNKDSPNIYDDKNKKSIYSSPPTPPAEEYNPGKEKPGYPDKDPIPPESDSKYNLPSDSKHQDPPMENVLPKVQNKEYDSEYEGPPFKKHKSIYLSPDEDFIVGRIYYYIDIAKCSREINGKYVYASLIELANSLKKASKMGITDIVLPESSFYISETNTITQLKELVKEARLNKITLNLFLDMQFSTPERVLHFLPEYFYKKTLSGKYIAYKGRYIHDEKNKDSELYIFNYVNKLSSIGIKNFILGELPRDVLAETNGNVKISSFINKAKLEERFNTIKKSAPHIILLYSYSNNFEEAAISSMNLAFDGSVFHIHNSDSQNLKSDRNFVTQMFREEPNKLLMLDFKLVQLKEANMKFLLGLYLFSPIQIILNIKDENYCPYIINILHEEPLTLDEIELKEKFIGIMSLKKTDTYFEKKSVIIGTTFDYEGIIIAVRGKDSFLITHYTVLYVFNSRLSQNTVSLEDIFDVKRPCMYQVIYDSKDLGNIGIILEESLELTPKQLLIIKILI